MRSLFDAPAMSVGELCRRIRRALASQFSGAVRVVGEVSKCFRAAGGHIYFALKDREGLIDCVCFESAASQLAIPLPLQDGLAVEVTGFLDIYAPKSAYQLRVTDIMPVGKGALHVAFEQLKARLAEQGLFARERKRPVPTFIGAVAVVTSKDAAVLRDFVSTCRRRGAHVKIRLVPTPVQGAAAAPALARAIRAAGRLPVDVIVVTRGGGSIEDLWAFNTEEVALAIAASPLPVISAVGHETDQTIADFVADLRVPTATAAAEFVAAERAALLERIAAAETRLLRSMTRGLRLPKVALGAVGAKLARAMVGAIADRAQRFESAAGSLARQDPRARIAAWRERTSFAARRLPVVAERALAGKRAAVAAALRHFRAGWSRSFASRRAPFDIALARLQTLGPSRTLARGYAIVYDAAGAVLTDATSTRAGESIGVELKSGSLAARVTETRVDAKDQSFAD